MAADSKASIHSSTENKLDTMRAASSPIVPITSVEGLKEQISAPSYFHSMKENDLPPFVKPGHEPYPKLIMMSIFNEHDVIQMIASAEDDKENGLKKFLAHILVEKKITHSYNYTEKNYLINLITETIDYAAQRDFNPLKLAVLLTLYMDSHCYFKWYYWQSAVAIWNYFHEMMIRHTIEDSPIGQEVFNPDECYDIITHFHTVYMSNLPLVHINSFGTYRLKLVWPFIKR